MDSLTGDPATDALVPVAQQLVGAVRAGDAVAVDEAFAAAIIATGGRCNPAEALAVVLAAMVPDNHTPSFLLKWMGAEAEYRRLLGQGIPTDVARELSGQTKRTAA